MKSVFIAPLSTLVRFLLLAALTTLSVRRADFSPTDLPVFSWGPNEKLMNCTFSVYWELFLFVLDLPFTCDGLQA